jgi:histidine ammonia-lyase
MVLALRNETARERSSMTVVLESVRDFSLDTVRRVAWEGEAVVFGVQALSRMRSAREQFLNLVEREPNLKIYGVTTGYDDAAGTIASAEERARLVKNPPEILAAGVGEPMPERVVRAMVFTRLINFVSGYTGLSLPTAQQVADMLDGRPLPVVRLQGQDSQGELLQLTNLYSGLDRARFEPRDANALVNGTGCTPGLLADVALRARRRTEIITRSFALSIDAASMGLDPYDPALKDMMGDEHQAAAIDALSGLLEGVPMTGRRTHQNPISWRILAPMLGHMYRTVAAVEEAATIALSRVNDNPVFIGPSEAAPNGRVISTGGFHNPAGYHAMNWLSATWADLAVLAARETEKMHLNAVTGLPPNLVRDGGAGTRLLAITSYDLAGRAREHAIPALIPLYSAGSLQTDTIMPIFLAFEKETGASHCLDSCLAILCACSSQALHVAGREPAPALRGFLAGVRRRFPPVETARDLGGDAQRLAGDFGEAVLEHIGVSDLA